ncbi:MAG: hypothetical protein JWN48_2112 [Myxococcaceae bacterium]|nr:hypothetical protein [Myxococcaceae bacterium]
MLAALALLSLVALFAAAPIFAVDFFWHLKLGQLIWSDHAIPRTDLFSAVHPERPYVQFQWLWELLVYAAYRARGLWGVRLLQVVTLTLSFAMLGRASLRLLSSRALAFCFCALGLVLFEDRFQTRPSATLLGFVAIILPLLLDSKARESRHARALSFAIGCVWSNVHSGESLLWPLCLVALTLGSALDRRLLAASAHPLKVDASLLLAASAGVLSSPALIAGLVDWTRAIGPQLASGNKEWRPSYTMLENGITPSYLLIALAPTLITIAYVVEQRARRGRGRRREGAWSEWLLCFGLLVLAQLAVRNAFLCLVPLCFMLRRVPPLSLRRIQRLLAALGATLLLIAFHDHIVRGYGGVARAREVLADDLAPNAFPEELATFMREAHIEGNVLNDGRWGGYLIWQLWPACHVFVDTRQDLTAAMWPVFLRSQHADTRPAALETAFRRWGTELSAFRGPTFPIIRAPDEWQLLYKAGDQELYQHRAGPHAASNQARAARWLRAQSASVWRPERQTILATEVGARIWLQGAARKREIAEIRQRLQSPLREDIAEGLLREGELLFEAGHYAEARLRLEPLFRLEGTPTKAFYRYALASYAVGDTARAAWALTQLAPRRDALSSAQRGRLAVLERALKAVSTSSAPPP